MRYLMMIAVILFSTACSGLYRHEVAVPGRNAANNAAGMAAAQNYLAPANPEVNDICETESLGFTRDSYQIRADELRNCPDCAEDTLVLVSEFFNEIDASYRMASSSCRAYARCMQNNFYDEGECRSSLSSWERARTDFAALSRELREIEAEVERDRINRRGHHGRRGHYLNRYERCDCSQSTGGVFANCCDR